MESNNHQDNHLIWLDLEMTGLNPELDRIIEIATIITNTDLEILEEGPVFAIHQSDARLEAMDDWNSKQHGESGLLQRVRESIVTEAEAELKTLNFVQQYTRAWQSPLCGNTVCQDRRFLYRYMPKLAAHFHYRNLDVSTIKILATHWAPRMAAGLQKAVQHQALQDIRDSIAELRYYRKNFFTPE